MFGKAFKPRQHYVFNYTPRYYNERKERIKKLEQKYHGNLNTEETIERISLSKNDLRSSWNRQKSFATDRKSTLRLAIIIAILVGLAAYVLDLHTLF